MNSNSYFFRCLLGIFLLSGCGNSEKQNTHDETVNTAKTQLSHTDIASGTIFEGSAEQFRGEFVFQQGTLNTLTPYNGEVKILDENAKLTSHDRYLEGKLDGLSTRWWNETGNKKLEITYKSGKPNGLKEEWFSDGARKVEQGFQDGVPHGKEFAWYPNGQKQYEHSFEEGKPHGVWTDWDDKGEMSKSIRYENGKVVEQIYPK